VQSSSTPCEVGYKYRNAGEMLKIGVKLSVISDYLHISKDPNPLPKFPKVLNFDKIKEDFLKTGRLPELGNVELIVKFMRVGDNVVVPGNTVKGAIRSRLELLFDCSCYNSFGRGSSTGVSSRYVNIFHPKDKGSDEFDEDTNMYICPVCNVFGTAGLASRVIFTDLKLTDSTKIGMFSHEGVVYEVVTKNAEFVGSIIMKGLDEDEIGMVLYGMGCRGSSDFKVMLLGRFKYERRDFGRVKFSIIDGDNKPLLTYCKNFIEKYREYLNDVEEDWR